MYGYIYLITNVINQKKYVGMHRSLEFNPNYKGSGLILWKAYKKYGFDNFTTEILEWCLTKEITEEREKFWIKQLNTFLKNGFGYNIALGGNGGHLTYGYTIQQMEIYRKKLSDNSGSRRPEVKKKLSLALSGSKHPMYGKHHTNETKNKISLSNKGKQSGQLNGMYGVNIYANKTEEEKINIKNKISKSVINSWSDERKIAHSKSRYGKSLPLKTLEQKRKISVSQKERQFIFGNPMKGKNHTLETKIKMSKNHANFSNSNHPKAKTIIVIDENFEEVKRFGSMKECYLEMNISKSTLQKLIKNSSFYKSFCYKTEASYN